LKTGGITDEVAGNMTTRGKNFNKSQTNQFINISKVFELLLKEKIQSVINLHKY
jgi:hypothetical protein